MTDVNARLGSVKNRLSFYLDENTDIRIVDPLRQHGITVITAEDTGLLREKDDAVHLTKATELGCVLVMGDRDFEALHKQICEHWLENSNIRHAGIIILNAHMPPRGPGRVARSLIKIYATRTADDFINVLRYA